MPVEVLHESAAWKAQPVTVSALLITYNQQAFVADAVRSVLAQTYPLDLLISDDSSTDETVGVICDTVQSVDSPHRVRLRSGFPNLRVVGNQNAGLRLLEGELVVLFEGDDVSRPDRVQRLVDLYLQHDRQLAAFGSSIQTMNPQGEDIERIDWPLLAGNARDVWTGAWGVHGCGLAFRRTVFSEFGPISTHLFSGDGPLWQRAAFSRPGGVAQIREPLVRYRLHGTNVSSRIRVDYTTRATLAESCRYLRDNEVAQALEVRKIERYLRARGVEDEELQAWKRVVRKRAAMVHAVATLPWRKWWGPLINAMREPALRPLALRFTRTALR